MLLRWFLIGLVGGDWNMNLFFPHFGNVIIPTDEHIFQRVWNHQPVGVIPLDSFTFYVPNGIQAPDSKGHGDHGGCLVPLYRYNWEIKGAVIFNMFGYVVKSVQQLGPVRSQFWNELSKVIKMDGSVPRNNHFFLEVFLGLHFCLTVKHV